MKTICSLLIVLIVLVLSACGPATQAPPAPTIPIYAPPATATPVPTATPTPTAEPTLSAQDAAIEAAWLVQKPKIDAAVADVYIGLASPWLIPTIDTVPTNSEPVDSPAAECLAMKLWSKYIPLPDSVAECRASNDPIVGFFSDLTMPLESTATDNLIMEVFPFMPLPYCDGVNPCSLLPGPGGAYWGMTIGKYKIVTYCGKPVDNMRNSTLFEPNPYLKDPVSMILLSTEGYGYIQIVANRGAWFSYGWISGKGWSESYQFCPTY